MSFFLPGDLIVFGDDAMLVTETHLNENLTIHDKYVSTGFLIRRGYAWRVHYNSIDDFLRFMNRKNTFQTTFVRPE